MHGQLMSTVHKHYTKATLFQFLLHLLGYYAAVLYRKAAMLQVLF
jgi:hypothetical protein